MPKGGKIMKSYLAEIDEMLEGQTPKEKFEWLKNLINENARAKGRIDFCKRQFEIIRTGSEPYTKGYIESIMKTLDKEL